MTICRKNAEQALTHGLSKWKGQLCSACELFTDINILYVPIHRFLPNCTLTKTVEYLKSLGESFYDSFADMMIFDALSCNANRHFENFGLLVDSATNKPIGLASIFDNDLSLFNYAMEDDLQEIDKYALTRTPAFEGVSYDALVNEFLSDRKRKQLRKLINFKFEKHPKYNLPAYRLKIIEAFVQTRVQKILDTKR